MTAVVERDEDLAFGRGEKRPPAHGVLPDRVRRRVAGQALDDLGPRLAAVVGPEDVRPHVVEADAC